MHDWNEYSAIVREKVPLAPFTTWRIGGSARWYAQPSADSLPGLLALANAIQDMGALSKLDISSNNIPQHQQVQIKQMCEAKSAACVL